MKLFGSCYSLSKIFYFTFLKMQLKKTLKYYIVQHARDKIYFIGKISKLLRIFD